MNKTILITGAGTGFGKDASIALAKKGYNVIAATHIQSDADKMNDLALEEKLSIESIVLDVTKTEDRKKVLKYDIDVLVNNAGMGETGSLSEIDIDKVRNNFEVNVFGPLELTQLVLKKMVEKDKGKVVFISSILGRVTMEFYAPYSMTKFSLSSGSEALRKELSRISKNIFVSVIEPGAFTTGFNQRMLNTKFAWMDKDSYFYDMKDELKEREEKTFYRIEQRSLKAVTNAIIQIVESNKPKFRYVAPWWQGLFVQILRILGR